MYIDLQLRKSFLETALARQLAQAFQAAAFGGPTLCFDSTGPLTLPLDIARPLERRRSMYLNGVRDIAVSLALGARVDGVGIRGPFLDTADEEALAQSITARVSLVLDFADADTARRAGGTMVAPSALSLEVSWDSELSLAVATTGAAFQVAFSYEGLRVRQQRELGTYSPPFRPPDRLAQRLVTLTIALPPIPVQTLASAFFPSTGAASRFALQVRNTGVILWDTIVIVRVQLVSPAAMLDWIGGDIYYNPARRRAANREFESLYASEWRAFYEAAMPPAIRATLPPSLALPASVRGTPAPPTPLTNRIQTDSDLALYVPFDSLREAIVLLLQVSISEPYRIVRNDPAVFRWVSGDQAPNFRHYLEVFIGRPELCYFQRGIDAHVWLGLTLSWTSGGQLQIDLFPQILPFLGEAFFCTILPQVFFEWTSFFANLVLVGTGGGGRLGTLGAGITNPAPGQYRIARPFAATGLIQRQLHTTAEGLSFGFSALLPNPVPRSALLITASAWTLLPLSRCVDNRMAAEIDLTIANGGIDREWVCAVTVSVTDRGVPTRTTTRVYGSPATTFVALPLPVPPSSSATLRVRVPVQNFPEFCSWCLPSEEQEGPARYDYTIAITTRTRTYILDLPRLRWNFTYELATARYAVDRACGIDPTIPVLEFAE